MKWRRGLGEKLPAQAVGDSVAVFVFIDVTDLGLSVCGIGYGWDSYPESLNSGGINARYAHGVATSVPMLVPVCESYNDRQWG